MSELSSRRKTLSTILKTSLPAATDLSSQTLTWVVEAIFIGNLSTAALAGVGIAHSIGFILTLILLRSRKASLFLAVREITQPSFPTFKRLIKIGIPTTIEQMVWAIGQLLISIYAGWLGIVVLATHQVFIRIQGVITMIFFGFGIGSMTLVGKSLGADELRQVRRTGMINGVVGLSLALIIAIFLLNFSSGIISMFTIDDAVISLGESLIFIFALIQLPKGANIVFSGNLRGSAELTWLMWLAISTVTVYEVFGSWFLAIPLGLGLPGLWMIQGMDELTRLCLNFWRFSRGKWKEIPL